MKKLLFFASAAIALVSTSCQSPEDSTASTSCSTYNFITKTDGSVVSVYPCVYSVNFNFTQSTVALANESMNVGGSETTTFATVNMPLFVGSFGYQGDGYCANGYYEVIRFSSKDAGSTKVGAVKELSGSINSTAYYSTEYIPEVGNQSFPYNSKYLIMKYNLGEDMLVRTFWPDALFCGKTVTTYTDKNGVAGSYETEGIGYRVVLDVSKKKASMVLYNAKFAEQSPLMTLVLKDLDLSFNANGYVISGTNVIPKTIEGSVLQDNPSFPINDITFTVSGDDLTQAQCSYTVAGRFHGSLMDASYLAEFRKR